MLFVTIPIVDSELINQEEDGVDHGKGEEDFDPKMKAFAMQEELSKLEKLEDVRGCK